MLMYYTLPMYAREKVASNVNKERSIARQRAELGKEGRQVEHTCTLSTYYPRSSCACVKTAIYEPVDPVLPALF